MIFREARREKRRIRLRKAKNGEDRERRGEK